MDNRGFAHENYDKFHIFVCFIAAIAVIAACLIRGDTLFVMALLTSIAIIVFWFLGNLLRYYIVTQIFPPPVVEEFVYDESMFDEMELEELGGDTAAEEVMADAPANPEPAPHNYMSE